VTDSEIIRFHFSHLFHSKLWVLSVSYNDLYSVPSLLDFLRKSTIAFTPHLEVVRGNVIWGRFYLVGFYLFDKYLLGTYIVTGTYAWCLSQVWKIGVNQIITKSLEGYSGKYKESENHIAWGMNQLPSQGRSLWVFKWLTWDLRHLLERIASWVRVHRVRWWVSHLSMHQNHLAYVLINNSCRTNYPKI
jgi:hypothetical protein